MTGRRQINRVQIYHMITIANFILDEKFIDGLIDYHDYVKTDCRHDYYLVSDTEREYKYIKKHPDRIIVIKVKEVLNTAARYDAVFLHSLPSLPISLIPKISKSVKVFWFSWGYDIYSLPCERPLIKMRLYHPLTRRFVIRDIKYQFLYLLRIFNSYRRKKNYYYYLRAVRRIDYYSGVIPEEYDMLKNKFSGFKAARVNYIYWNINSLPKKDFTLNTSRNIIIGNSTSFEMNHLDVFNALKDIDLTDRKIYVPLSYAPNPKYVDKLIKEGKKLFGDRFVAITDFLPFNEYMLIFNSCGFAIYGTERQMGMGNIIMCLDNGCKVFLYKSSTVYHHYKKHGVRVYSIEEDLLKEDAFHNLEKEIIRVNKDYLDGFLNKKVLIDNLLSIYNIINESN